MTPERDPDKGGDYGTSRFVNPAPGAPQRNALRSASSRWGLLLRGTAVLVRVIFAIIRAHLLEMSIHLLGLNGLPAIRPRPAAARQASADERESEGETPRGR